MKELTKTEKIWNSGEEIYHKFCNNFPMSVMTPKTTTLEMFHLLHQKGETELLLREMMSEFMRNLSDEKVIVKNNKLYCVVDKLETL